MHIAVHVYILQICSTVKHICKCTYQYVCTCTYVHHILFACTDLPSNSSSVIWRMKYGVVLAICSMHLFYSLSFGTKKILEAHYVKVPGFMTHPMHYDFFTQASIWLSHQVAVDAWVLWSSGSLGTLNWPIHPCRKPQVLVVRSIEVCGEETRQVDQFMNLSEHPFGFQLPLYGAVGCYRCECINSCTWSYQEPHALFKQSHALHVHSCA